MSNEILINIAEEFSAYPIGRDESDSEKNNGQRFRREFLLPKLKDAEENHRIVVISFEGVESFGSSFLEEAFGGLVREDGWTSEKIKKFLRITYDWSGYKRFERRMWDYIEAAKPND